MFAKLIAFLQRHIIAPITTKEGAVDYIITIRAVALSVAFMISVVPFGSVFLVWGLHVYDSQPPAGLACLLAGYAVFCIVWLSMYLIARFVTKRPSEWLCDLLAVGCIISIALWDIATPTALPYGAGQVLIITMVSWCDTPRALPLFLLTMLGYVMQVFNHVTFRNDLRDRMIHFEAATTTLSRQLNMTVAPFESNFPVHLYLEKDYYFPLPQMDACISVANGLIPVALFFGLQYMTAQLRKEKAEAQGAVDTILAIADALSKYDTTTAKATLDAAQGRVPERSRQEKYAPSSRSASLRHHPASTAPSEPGHTAAAAAPLVADVKLSADLVEPLVALVANLDAYRPYLPNWLLETSGEDEDSASGSPDGKRDDATVSSINSTSRDNTSCSRLSGQHFSRSPRGAEMPEPIMSAAQPRPVERQCSFAVVTFEAAGEGALPASSAALGAFVDVLHSAAAETKGAVHSFALGEALLSWNCATACANPESKAAAFVARLRAVAGAALADLCCSAAVVTGLARCETAGSGQRAVTSMAPVAAVRLRGLSAFARAAAVEGGAGFAGLCDEATATGARTNVVTSPAGVVDLSHAAPIPSTASVLLPPPSSVLLPPPQKEENVSGVSSELLPATWTADMALASAFEIVSPRDDFGDEWLYAMVDGPSDVAAKALTEMAAALAQCVGPPPPPSRQPPTYVRAAVEAASGLSTMRQAMGTAAAAMDRAAGLGADGAVLSQRPLWVAWLTSVRSSALNF